MLTLANCPQSQAHTLQGHRLCLIDGSGFIFRAFHALPPLNRPDGTPVNAVLGYCNMMTRLIKEYQEEYLLVVFDAGRSSFRQQIWADYKAHRPPAPPELIPQFEIIRQACDAFNVRWVEKPGFEADDIIASYAKLATAAGMMVTVVSSDKDLMQLVSDQVQMLDPLKNRLINHAQVEEKFGVGPDKVIEVQALAGDASDNVPGIPGFGPKTAAELILQYGTVENLIANAEHIKQPRRRQLIQDHAQQALISKQLVTLRQDVEIEGLPLTALQRQPVNYSKLLDFLTQQHFSSLINKFKAYTTNEADLVSPAPNSNSPTTQPSSSLTKVICTDLVTWQQWRATVLNLTAISVDYQETTVTGLALSSPTMVIYLPVESINAELQQSLSDLFNDRRVLKIGHNWKPALLALKPYVEVTHHLQCCHDIAVISYLLHGMRINHELFELAELYLQITLQPEATYHKTNPDLNNRAAYYSTNSHLIFQLYELMYPELQQRRHSVLYHRIDLPLLHVLMNMESKGICIDTERLLELSAEFATHLDQIALKIYAQAGEEFNIASPKQLGDILFNKLGLPADKRSKTGAYSTGADILEALNLGGYTIAGDILEWRQIAKLKNTYADSLVTKVNPNTRRIHTLFSAIATTTGRLSSSEPNLQNIPIKTTMGKHIRRAFHAATDKVLMSFDYSQIELRILAHIAQVTKLITAFASNQDIHRVTAQEIFGVSEVNDHLRRQAKAINFGIIYGLSAFGLSQHLKISTHQANEFINLYFQRYPEIKAYMERTKELARHQGFVETLWGRRCFIDKINDRNPAIRHGAERQAINAPIQGTQADFIRKAMVQIPPALTAAGLSTVMLLQVHDELVFEGPEAEFPAVQQIVVAKMANVGHLSVPLIINSRYNYRWDYND